MFNQLAILAPGLLGGSVARAARARGVAKRISIWGRRRETQKAVAGQPWCDNAPATPEEAVEGADLVVIAAPVDFIVPLARQVSRHLKAGAVVTDVGSVKGRICREAREALGGGAPFVGAHPMAGSEKTGWEHGSETLFDLSTCFVTPLPDADRAAVDSVCAFWRSLGSTVVTVDPDLHDQIVAHISHLPQVLASVLCATLATKDPTWRQYAGKGLRDTTRIAGSDPKLWRTILEGNRESVLQALRHFQIELHAFEQALARDDWAEVTSGLARGKTYRDLMVP